VVGFNDEFEAEGHRWPNEQTEAQTQKRTEATTTMHPMTNAARSAPDELRYPARCARH
jgi:hypothetical protein